jgi:hypothetical protein
MLTMVMVVLAFGTEQALLLGWALCWHFLHITHLKLTVPIIDKGPGHRAVEKLVQSPLAEAQQGSCQAVMLVASGLL